MSKTFEATKRADLAGEQARRRGLLLDVDGVLVRSWFGWALEGHYGITPETTRAFFQGPFQQCSVGQGDLRACLAPVLPAWGWPGSVDGFLEFWFTAGTVLESDVVAAIRAYRGQGVQCYLATVQERYRLENLLWTQGLADDLDGWFCSVDLGCDKRDPHFWAEVRAALPGHDLLLVDDDNENVRAARAAGIPAETYAELPDLHTAVRTHFGLTVDLDG